MDFLIENHNLYTRNQSKLQLLEKILPVYVLRENEIKQDFWHKNCKILLVEHSPLEFQAKNLGKNTASCNFEVWTENQLETNLPKFLTAHSCSFIKNSQTTFKKTSTDGSNTDTETCSLYPVHPKFTNFIRYKSISSTMDQPNIKSGQVVIADVQTSGKGRKNNSWISPLGACYFTFYLDLPKNFAI